MKDVVWVSHPNTVSGITEFDTGHRVFWTEGRGSGVVIVHPDGRKEFTDSDRCCKEFLCVDGPAPDVTYRDMTPEEEIEWDTLMAF